MLNLLGRIMPYFIVIKFIKKFGSDILHSKELGQCRGFRIGKGEWIIWSQDNYDIMTENEKNRREFEKEAKEQEEKEKYEQLKEKFTNQNLGEEK